MNKMYTALPLIMVFVLLFAGVASAHVVVYPQSTMQGIFDKFTVRVPNEKDIPTVTVEVDIPLEVDISLLKPEPGWKYGLTKDASGKITKIIWTSTGEGLAASEFGEFNMEGIVSKKATTIVWKAHQTYKDGSVVNWVGDDKSDTPAPVTRVNPVPKNIIVSDDGDIESDTSVPNSAPDPSNLPLYISIAALILGLFSSVVSLKKARR